MENTKKSDVSNFELPMVIQFSTLSLCAEDKMNVEALSKAHLDRDIFVLYDEADFIQTKEQRYSSAAKFLNNARMFN